MIVYPECNRPAMFQNELYHPKAKIDLIDNRKAIINKTKDLLHKYNVDAIFAYNARFDYGHLKELSMYKWYDIMKIAAYIQYNPYIPEYCPICTTGRLKHSYGLESIYKMVVGNHYSEIHNALTDALDELALMKALNHDLSLYDKAIINP